jgi:predicted TIM-barrel fold metal-dependent hydrolase
MKAIDMHLNPLSRPDLDRVATASVADLGEACRGFGREFKAAGVQRGVMVLLNPALLDGLGAASAGGKSLATSEFVFAYAVDFRRPDAADQLAAAHRLGIRALKFHPYLQRVEAADFPLAGEVARTAEGLGMFVMVCCAYGTRALDRYSGVRLAAYLSEQVSCPIVMSHAGGARILDAMLVAAAASNLYLDTSYSLPYYLGSSVEGDFAFAMRKLGSGRWVYGSDAPFDDLTRSLQVTLEFLDRHGFRAREIEDVLYGTAAGILGGGASC